MTAAHIMTVICYWLAVAACGALGVFGAIAVMSVSRVHSWYPFAVMLLVPLLTVIGVTLSTRSDSWLSAFGWLSLPLIPVAVLLSLVWWID